MKIGVHSDAYNRGFFDGYNSAVKNMEHQLDEANKAREQAEAALGEAVGIIKGLLVIRDSDFSFVTMSTYTGAKLKADQFLQSPVVEQAGERRRALEAQNEIMRGALEAIIVLDKDSITGNARAYYMQRIAKDALDACERVKGDAQS